MNYFKLKAILSITALIATPWGGPRVQAIQPAPQLPIPTFKMMKPLTQIAAAPIAKLELAGFPVSPMGTYGNSYAPANCTWGAASMIAGLPADWGNANTWDDHARAEGITVSDVPVVGAVAQTDRGLYGHVAVVDAVLPGDVVQITEMNYDDNGSVRTRLAAPGEFVYIYI